MAFVNWEEMVVSNDKGRRLVHYYLKDKLGFRVLAVVGREKSLRHMSYEISSRYSTMMTAAATETAASCCPSSSNSSAFDLKWKSRREVIDWLASIVSDGASCATLSMSDRFSDDEDVEPTTTISASKGLSSGKMGLLSKEFSWLGAAWDCRKKRKHYRSFNRNGITISVHDFVYVMAEDSKRLVAYVEDLYEDIKTNNMVVVRWFHKVDEVGIVLPSDVNDREIFSSLCLQDFSVECIDGFAAVLSAQDFDKFQNEARYRSSSWEPYLCWRQIDNDDVKPFDITQVQGYWSQELLRLMYATPGTSLKLRLKITHGGSSSSNGDGLGERSRLNSDAVNDIHKSKSFVGSKGEKYTRTSFAPPLLRKELFRQKLLRQQKHLVPGCRVEVLSQDCGMRGCWFQCVVLKKHHDKVKVRYQDVQNADDTGNLEEWVLASRVASPDKLGIWSCGRPVVRPDPSQSSNKISCSFDIGSIVDAWWYDGWWEGIVIQKESDGKICVYFPGEQLVSIFGLGDLRPSREWIGNKWNHIKEHQDVASSLLSSIDRENHHDLFNNVEQSKTLKESQTAPCNPLSSIDQSVVETDKGALVLDLSEFCHLDSLKWSSSGKRKRARELGKGKLMIKRPCGSGSSGTSSSSQEELEAKFLVPKSLPIVDHDKCKIGGDPMLVAPITLCSSLVMSQ